MTFQISQQTAIHSYSSATIVFVLAQGVKQSTTLEKSPIVADEYEWIAVCCDM